MFPIVEAAVMGITTTEVSTTTMEDSTTTMVVSTTTTMVAFTTTTMVAFTTTMEHSAMVRQQNNQNNIFVQGGQSQGSRCQCEYSLTFRDR